MLKIVATNPAGVSLNFETNDKYQIVSATGLNPPVATINTAEMATADGSIFNMARLPQRNIVLTIQPLYGIEKARDDLYKWFAPKQAVSLSFTTSSRDMSINGYVESFECDLFANPQLVQVSIICPEPYLKGAAVNNVSIPAALAYAGDASTGVVFDVTMTGTASALTLVNTVNGVPHTFTLTGLSLQSGDVVTIDTRVGQKSVKRTRSSSVKSLIANVSITSEWLQLMPGMNNLTITVDNGTAKVSYVPLFMGV